MLTAVALDLVASSEKPPRAWPVGCSMSVPREATHAAGELGVYLRPAREAEIPIAVAIDDDACEAFAALDPQFAIDLPDDHPFLLAEIERWRRAAARGGAIFACAASGDPVGLLVLDRVGGRPYLEQVSVRRGWIARGIGRMLVEHAIRWSAPEGELWLTTYDRVPWNRPWYQCLGFTVVSDESAVPELCEILRAEREALPAADARVAMVFRHPRG